MSEKSGHHSHLVAQLPQIKYNLEVLAAIKTPYE